MRSKPLRSEKPLRGKEEGEGEGEEPVRSQKPLRGKESLRRQSLRSEEEIAET